MYRSVIFGFVIYENDGATMYRYGSRENILEVTGGKACLSSYTDPRLFLWASLSWTGPASFLIEVILKYCAMDISPSLSNRGQVDTHICRSKYYEYRRTMIWHCWRYIFFSGTVFYAAPSRRDLPSIRSALIF